MFDPPAHDPDLFAQMTKALQRDPAIAVDDFSAAVKWRVAMRKCATCDKPGACADLLARTPQLQTPPRYCRNGAYLLNLPKAQD